MRVQVRKCPFTGKLFEEKDAKKYAVHLKELRVKMREERRHKYLRDNFTKWLKKEKKAITHPEMIPEWFMANQRQIMEAHNAGIRSKLEMSLSDRFFITTDRFENVEFEKGTRFNDLLSNSHTCPENGKTNWCATENDTPKGYPGWKTYIKGTLVRDKKNNHSYPYNAALNLVGIKTGSGGGGNKDWGYQCSIFLADWPGLKVAYKEILEERHQREAQEIVNRLKGKR